jgi:hypothetical protein
MAAERYRLVTRSDFDGLVCAVLLKALDLVDDIAFVHPKDVQDGVVPIGPGDITTNLPYSPQAHLVVDHHLSETLRNLRIAPTTSSTRGPRRRPGSSTTTTAGGSASPTCPRS